MEVQSSHESWQLGPLCCRTDSASPSCFWKTSSQKIPFTTPSRPLTLIYAGSCFTVSKTVVVSLSASQSYEGLYTCMWATNITHSTRHRKHALLWAFSPPGTWCTKCLAAAHGEHSAHLILMHFISPPFPSAVPLIFHIRRLIITASRTICFWPNLPPSQINISRQVKFSFHRGLWVKMLNSYLKRPVRDSKWNINPLSFHTHSHSCAQNPFRECLNVVQ